MSTEELEQLQRAAAGGDAEAWYKLGLLHDNAEGAERDAAKAANCYREAVELGHALAMNNLGVMTLNGDGVTQNAPLAFNLIKMSAARGNAQAMFNLALLFERGLGTPPDSAAVLQWLEKAHAAGHAEAASALNRLRGQVPANPLGDAVPPPATPPTSPPGTSKTSVGIAVAIVVVVVISAIIVLPFARNAWREAQWQKAVRHAESLENAQQFTEAIGQMQAWTRVRDHGAHAEQKIRDLKFQQADALLAKGEAGAAAELLESLNEKARAAAAYETAGRVDDAVRLYMATKTATNAAADLRRLGRAADAVALLRRSGYPVSGEECEAAGLWADAGAAYERELKLEKAARAYQKAGNRKHAAEILGRTDAWREGVAFLEGEEQWNAAGDIYEKKSQWKDAAQAYEKGGDVQKAAAVLEKAHYWEDAARAYEKAGDPRKAAAMLEKAHLFVEAARQYEVLAKTDRDVSVRIEGARLYRLGGRPDKSKALLDDALTIAKSFGNFQEILSISKDMGQLASGIDYVVTEGDRLQASDQLFEAEEAYGATSPYLGQDSPFDVTTHNQLVGRVNAAMTSLRARMEAYPKLDSIEGVNNYLDNMFTHTQISGTLRNTTGKTVQSVTIRIKLFKKSFDAMWRGTALPALDGIMKQYESSDAGFTRDIVLANIAPGESRTFSERLGNSVPYQSYSSPMSGLRLAP